MLNPTAPSNGLLFGSFLYREDLHEASELQKIWEEQFGESFKYIPAFNPLNTYYEKEMGTPLSRFFLVSAKPFPREFLLTSKLLALEFERSWAKEGKRAVNIDTGILTAENFLLATTKNYSHRVYIGQNIFADLTYHFSNGAFEVFPWTYPDFQDQEKIKFFTWCRGFLLGNA